MQLKRGEKKRLGCIIYLRLTQQQPTGVLIVINILGPVNFHPHAPPPLLTPQEHLTSFDCIHVPASLPSALSPCLPVCLSLFSHPAGGRLAQECGIINFLEWQTLDVRRTVLSHPLLAVPQPPSLLPVILHLLHRLPKQPSTRFIHLMLSQG